MNNYTFDVISKIQKGLSISWIEKQHLRKFFNNEFVEEYRKMNSKSLIGMIKVAIYDCGA